jgi:head-tail adaptor
MQINGKPFNPGELRTPIVLASKKMEKNSAGFQVPVYTFLADVKARWTNVHGQEVWAADARGAIKPATIMIRYRPDLDETCVVVKGAAVEEVIDEHDVLTGWTFTGGEIYEIVSMDNIQDLNEYIELKIKRIAAG